MWLVFRSLKRKVSWFLMESALSNLDLLTISSLVSFSSLSAQWWVRALRPFKWCFCGKQKTKAVVSCCEKKGSVLPVSELLSSVRLPSQACLGDGAETLYYSPVSLVYLFSRTLDLHFGLLKWRLSLLFLHEVPVCILLMVTGSLQNSVHSYTSLVT